MDQFVRRQRRVADLIRLLGASTTLIPPKVLEPVGSHFGVSDRVLDVLVPEVVEGTAEPVGMLGPAELEQPKRKLPNRLLEHADTPRSGRRSASRGSARCHRPRARDLVDVTRDLGAIRDFPLSVPPKVLEPVGRHVGIPDRVLNVLVPEVVLQGRVSWPSFANLNPQAWRSMCGWIGNGILATFPRRWMRRWKPMGLIGPPRSENEYVGVSRVIAA